MALGVIRVLLRNCLLWLSNIFASKTLATLRRVGSDGSFARTEIEVLVPGALQSAFFGGSEGHFQNGLPQLSVGPVPPAGRSGWSASEQAGPKAWRPGKQQGAAERPTKGPTRRELSQWLPGSLASVPTSFLISWQTFSG